jgi:spore photoproduct lyase
MRILDKLDLIYDKNKSYKPVFVISEYTDLLAIDHIADHFRLFMDLIQKHDDLKLSFRTRSANVDRFIKYNGKDRVMVTIQLDPEYVIKNYQKNTSLLPERIQAISKVMNSTGFKMKIAIEPIIFYKGYEKDYVGLIQELAKHIDMNKVDNFDIGCFRASKNLQTCIGANYPKSDILDLEHPLEKPVGEKKWRYPLAERVKIYKILIDEIRKYSNSRISLGAENPEAWIQSGLQIPKSSNFYHKIK